MKFYAKSKKRVPEEVQKQRLMEALERLEERLGGELTEGRIWWLEVTRCAAHSG